MVGVGRGIDLVLYGLMVAFLSFTVTSYRRFRDLETTTPGWLGGSRWTRRRRRDHPRVPRADRGETLEGALRRRPAAAAAINRTR